MHLSPPRPIVLISLYLIFAGTWFVCLWQNQSAQWFVDHWFIAPTMMLGSFIAGSTAEGGGAIAFPVLTLGFGITPTVARDFTFMIQSVGMTSASLTILWLRAPVSWPTLRISGLMAIPGLFIGIEWISGYIPAPMTKLFFVNWWLGFALALYLANRRGQRQAISDINLNRWSSWLGISLASLLGGLISGLTGSGLDIVVFSFLVLQLGLREDVATRTSVLLMAWASLLGFGYKGLSVGMEPQAWNFWLIAMPVVIVGAPLGAWFMRSKSRDFVRRLLYTIIVLQFFTAFLVLPLSQENLLVSGITMIASLSFFYALDRFGRARA